MIRLNRAEWVLFKVNIYLTFLTFLHFFYDSETIRNLFPSFLLIILISEINNIRQYKIIVAEN